MSAGGLRLLRGKCFYRECRIIIENILLATDDPSGIQPLSYKILYHFQEDLIGELGLMKQEGRSICFGRNG